MASVARTCWLLKAQLLVINEGELFISFTRLKTISLHGVSMDPHQSSRRLCSIHAFAVLATTSGSPTPLVFNMFKRRDQTNVDDNEASPMIYVVICRSPR